MRREHLIIDKEWLRFVAGDLLLTCVAVSSVVLIGWLADIRECQSLLSGLPTMKFNTAVSLCCLAIAGLCYTKGTHSACHKAAVAFAAIAASLSATSVFEYICNCHTGLDTLFVADKVSESTGLPPGQMSLGTAIAILMLAAASVLQGKKGGVAAVFALLSAIVSTLAIVGFALLPTSWRVNSICSSTAIHTAIILLILSLVQLLLISIKKKSSVDEGVPSAFKIGSTKYLVRITWFAGITLSVMGALWSQGSIHTRERARFTDLVNSLANEIETNALKAIYGLHGARGMYAASPIVTRQMFADYVASRDLPLEFPGATGFGFIRRSNGSNLHSFRSQRQASRTLEQSSQAVEETSPTYVVEHIYPESTHRATWGMNFGGEHTLRGAMERAVTSGASAISQLRELHAGTGLGYLVFVPVYENNLPTDTTAERKNGLRGLLFAPMQLDAVLEDTNIARGMIDYGIVDGFRLSEEKSDLAEAQVWRTRSDEHRLPATFQQEVSIDLGGRVWRIIASSSQRFEAAMDRRSPALVFLGGIVISALLSAVACLVGLSHARAADLSEANLQLSCLNASLRDSEQGAMAGSRAKSEFLANMSHEIRTPLNAMIGLSELVLKTDLNTLQRDYLNTVASSGELLLSVINDILDYSKIEAGKLILDASDFLVLDCVGEVMKSLSVTAARKKLELTYRVGRDVPEVLIGDSNRLRQILINLVGNAIKFTHKGHVFLDVQRIESDPTAETVTLEFLVEDTGIGIAPENQQAIFTEFAQEDATTTRKYGGTGLGLTISERLVDAMGGKISVASQPGCGSIFRFFASFQPSEKQVFQPWRNMLNALRGTRVLLVDDHPVNLHILQDAITAYGMCAVTAQNGSEAFRLLETAASENEPFQAIVTDVNMPEMDGFELAKKVRASKLLSDTPIVMLASSGEIGDAECHNNLKISARLVKPVKRSDLLEAIVRAMDLHRPIEVQVAHETPKDTSEFRELRVLLAEDSVPNQKLVLAVLGSDGHETVVVDTGRQAVEMLATQQFDVVLMDIQMPEMDGYQATAAIRKRDEQLGIHTPIVAITAHALDGDREKCLAAGMDGYVSKPIRPNDLFTEIDRVLGTMLDHAPPKSDQPFAPPASEWDELLSAVGGDQSALQEIVEAYVQEINESIPRVTHAIHAGDSAALRRSAHKLKSALRVFQRSAEVDLAQQLENQGASGKLNGAEAKWTRLQESVHHLVNDLQQHP